MNSYRNIHLTYDEQLRAVVDANDLPGSCRRHLNECETCRNEVSGLEQRFVSMGKTAEKLAPAPKRPFRLPLETARSTGRRFNPIWATGAAAVLMLMIVLWRPERFAPDNAPDYALHDITPRQLADDLRFMADVDALIENALPEPFRELAASSAPPTDLDEDLINWIVPSIEEEASLT